MIPKVKSLDYTEKTIDCIVIGDVFMDVIVGRNEGYNNFSRGGTSYCDFSKVVLGGSGNVALGVSSLSGRVAFIGKAGKDYFGDLYEQDLRNNGIISKMFQEKDLQTGLIVALVERGIERSFLVSRGANDHLSIDDIEESADIIKRSKFLYCTGYSLVNDPQKSAIWRAIEIAEEFKTKIVFDPGAHNLVKSRNKLFKKVLKACNIFSANLSETQAITKTDHLEDAISKLKNRFELAAIRCGEAGCILINEKKVVRVPSFKVNCIDPTGAGDAFTAALIYGLINKLTLESIGKLSNWFAGNIVASIGSRSYPSNHKITQFLSEIKRSDHKLELA